tara:strand:- start:685 stop:1161 length:477 start_codon:yes stop_codon:yes gene_type:complete
MKLHKKSQGSIGELKVATDLIAKGFSVFTELGDNSKVDLIAIDNDTYRAFKIQVKARTSKKDAVKVETKKSGPNYQFAYEEKHSDVYAVYVQDRDSILYISAKEFLKRKTMMTIRFTVPKKSKNFNFHEDYLSIKAALQCDTNTNINPNQNMGSKHLK